MRQLACFLLLPFAAAACASTPPAAEPAATAATAATAAPEAASAAPSASASAAADMPAAPAAAPEAAPPPVEAFPSATGTLDGKPWDLKGAGTAGPVQKDGSVLIGLGNYDIDCGVHAATAGDRTIVLQIPWKEGAKLDLAKLKKTDVWATSVDDKKKVAALKTFKPTGKVEVLAAPTKEKSSGRIKIELKSGNDTITAEVPVKFCFPG
jgi:hypothetical protein